VKIGARVLAVNVLIVAVPIAGVFFAHRYEREMLRALEDDMVHQAEALRVLAAVPGRALEDHGPELAGLAAVTGARLRLLDGAGRVVADSGFECDEELGGRPEVVRALAGGYGAASRLEAGRVYLFVALPLRGGGVAYVSRSTAPAKLALYRLRRMLFHLFVGAVAATAIVSLFLAATISRPLGRLTRLAGRAAAGDRSVSLALHRKDEIGELARAFDALTHKLDGRARDVAELAANISHEFKSPLTSMRGAAELLLDGAGDDPAVRRRFLENVLGDCERLDRLVTRLLELSRVEADAAPLEPLDLHDLIAEAVERGRGPAPVVLDWRAGAAGLLGRRSHLLSALGNLIGNAQNHAAPGTAITVTVEGGAGRVRAAVHNHGPAIAAAARARLFERFFTTRGDAGGTGLGLAIVAAVAQAHGGSVAVASAAVAGTTFTLELPANSARAPAGESVSHDPGPSQTPRGAPRLASATRGASRPRRSDEGAGWSPRLARSAHDHESEASDARGGARSKFGDAVASRCETRS
jgi:two-component system sensor histidine kinase ChvG